MQQIWLEVHNSKKSTSNLEKITEKTFDADTEDKLYILGERVFKADQEEI
ncbi:MAG: hypothetical protein ISN64_00160 [Rickettsia sp.]|nr:hypothetical protein [Rickettsia sp.]